MQGVDVKKWERKNEIKEGHTITARHLCSWGKLSSYFQLSEPAESSPKTRWTSSASHSWHSGFAARSTSENARVFAVVSCPARLKTNMLPKISSSVRPKCRESFTSVDFWASSEARTREPIRLSDPCSRLPAMARSCESISSMYFWNSLVATPRVRSFLGRNDEDKSFFGSMAKVIILRKQRERASR